MRRTGNRATCGGSWWTPTTAAASCCAGAGWRSLYAEPSEVPHLPRSSAPSKLGGSARDQINHTRFLSDPDLLNLPRVRTIFLVRAPGPALSSMVEVLGHHYGTTLDQALSHYRTRLSDLERLAAGLTDPTAAFFLTYEALLDRTPIALAALSRFLGLHPPLSPRHRTHRFTGSAGDPSPNIRAGQVLRTPPRRPVLPAAVSVELAALYAQTCARLRARCDIAVT
jgi:hypothetical protein